MLSIENTYNHDEVREWDARIRKALNPGEAVRYAVELKVDGVAVSIRHEEGRLVDGVGRAVPVGQSRPPKAPDCEAEDVAERQERGFGRAGHAGLDYRILGE